MKAPALPSIKKGTAKLADKKGPSTHPYAVQQKYRDDRYFTTRNMAVAAVLHDLDVLASGYSAAGIKGLDPETNRDVDRIRNAVNALGLDGGTVRDSIRGVPYMVRVLRRTHA